jgi:hypothetical protein
MEDEQAIRESQREKCLCLALTFVNSPCVGCTAIAKHQLISIADSFMQYIETGEVKTGEGQGDGKTH